MRYFGFSSGRVCVIDASLSNRRCSVVFKVKGVGALLFDRSRSLKAAFDSAQTAFLEAICLNVWRT